jgi:hypothetical protein
MLGRNTIKFPHVTLGLVPKILDAVDMIFLISKQNRMVDPVVFEL